MNDKPTLYIFEHHHELLYLWRELGLKHIKLLHIDSHCDMHGLYVNRKKDFAHIESKIKVVDCGNFISFAIREGIVDGVKWLHDQYGGRDKDSTYIKYESDPTAIFHLARNYFLPYKNIPFRYSELLFAGQIPLSEDEHLDIDWDYFALKGKPDDKRREGTVSFLNEQFPIMPKYIYLTYSKDYASDSREEFESFAVQLQNKFNSELIRYSYAHQVYEFPKNIYEKYYHGLSWRFKRYFMEPIKKILQRIGIY